MLPELHGLLLGLLPESGAATRTSPQRAGSAIHLASLLAGLALVGCSGSPRNLASSITPSNAAQPVNASDFQFVGQLCNLETCDSVFRVEVALGARGNTETWRAGAYQVAITADGVDLRCTVVASDQSVKRCIASGAGAELAFSMGVTGTASARLVSAPESRENPLPRSLRIEMFYENHPIGTAQLTPTYRMAQPNGQQCPPTCWYAEAKLLVDYR